MKNFKGALLGVILVCIGIILCLNEFGVTDIDIFFKGWWTLFIIVPSLMSIFSDKEKTGGIIGLFIGVILLLSVNDVIDFDIILKLIFPAILVCIGLSIISKNIVNKDVSKKIDELNEKSIKGGTYCSTFSSQNINVDEEFGGCKLDAIFGGIKLDLRNAKIKKDVVINASAIFGGIDILVPDGVTVKIKSTSIFGGASNKAKNETNEKAHTIYVNATCLFGGVDVK